MFDAYCFGSIGATDAQYVAEIIQNNIAAFDDTSDYEVNVYSDLVNFHWAGHYEPDDFIYLYKQLGWYIEYGYVEFVDEDFNHWCHEYVADELCWVESDGDIQWGNSHRIFKLDGSYEGDE